MATRLWISCALLLALPFTTESLRFTIENAEEALQTLARYSFADFVRDYHRGYEPGTDTWKLREQLFTANLKDIVSFQEQKGRSWDKKINKFMDYTAEEFKAMLGYAGRGGSRPSDNTMFFSTKTQVNATLPSEHTVLRTTSNSLSKLVRDQGACGSCWAEASTSVLEGHMEANAALLDKMAAFSKQKYQTLSSQTIVSCTANPHHCGGKGGCEGATVELAYDMVKERGVPLAEVWPYYSSNGFDYKCKEDVYNQPRIGIDGYTVLPRNKKAPLLEALVHTNGPIAISVAASGWNFYGGGIYSEEDFDVNHAVTLVGYQMPSDKEKGWYVIKNSWGASWGEEGFIRVEMTKNEDELCGMSHHAHDGLACDGDPDDTWVCGSSGILYDSVYPEGLHFIKSPVE